MVRALTISPLPLATPPTCASPRKSRVSPRSHLPRRTSTMLDYDFPSSIGYWLITTHQGYLRAFNEKLAPEGITYRQAQVLGWLAAEGPLTQTELAARMLIEPPTLVGILDRA